ncbi:MAG: hypothetical protein IKM94_01840 [Alphaproteobacteria bacterium]|nr:hypothetical protein [Alphaproteobacteria bacterium]
MAGKNIFNISFQEIVSSDGYSTTDKIYSVKVGDLVVGKLVVPNDDKFVLDISFEDNFNNHYLKTRILNETQKKFQRDILFVDKYGKEKVLLANKQTNKPQKETSEWKRYYDFVNKYMGKYRNIRFNKQIGIELVFKKKAEIKDIVLAINTFLKKYPFVNFTVSQIVSKPVNINNTMSKTEIDAIVAHTMTWGEIKHNTTQPQQKNQEQVKTPTIKPVDAKPIESKTESIKSNDAIELLPDVDAVQKMKALQLTIGAKQTLDDAKKKAQHLANLQSLTVKLLDVSGKFIGYIVPQNVEEMRKARIKEIKKHLAMRQR